MALPGKEGGGRRKGRKKKRPLRFRASKFLSEPKQRLRLRLDVE